MTVELVGHEGPRSALRALAASGEPVPPLLFAGPAGVGKRTAALAFAASLVCRTHPGGEPCGRCLGCLRVQDAPLATEIGARRGGDAPELYGDVGLVGVPEGKTRISVQQARDVVHSLSQRPFELTHRVYVIDEAERMNAASANALLKVLEEPPTWGVLVLVTPSPWSLPATIRSRLRTIRFGLLSLDDVVRVLARHGIEEDRARARARLSRGAPGVALALDPEQEQERVAILFDILQALASGAPPGEIAVAAGDAFGTSADNAASAIATLLALLRDAAAVAHGAPALHLDDDRARALAPAVDILAGPALTRARALETLRAEITIFNRNPRLAIEGAVLALAGRAS